MISENEIPKPKSIKSEDLYAEEMSTAEQRDKEQFDMIRKQNLCEIKNLIDYEIKTANTRNQNEQKIKKKEQIDKEKYHQKLKEKEFKENQIRQKEKEKEENDKKMLKLQTLKTKKYFMEQLQKRKKELKEEIEQQKMNLKKQLENQKKEEEFRTKLKEKFLYKQHQLEMKQDELDKKAIIRQQKIDKSKQEISNRYSMQSQIRELRINNVKRRNQQALIDRLNKYNLKQAHIEKQRAMTQKKKEREFLENKMRVEEQEKKNNERRGRNAKLMELRRIKLIEKFRDNDIKIEKQKEINEEKIKNINYKNAQKKFDADECVKEKQMQLYYKNSLKLQNILYRQKKAEDLLFKKYLLSQKKIMLKDEMKDKKESLIKKVNNIISQGKICDRNYIYKKVFSKDDLRILCGSISCTNFTKKNSFDNIEHVSLLRRSLDV